MPEKGPNLQHDREGSQPTTHATASALKRGDAKTNLFPTLDIDGPALDHLAFT